MKKKERIVARDGHRIKNRPKKKCNRTPIIYLFSLAQSKMLTKKREREKERRRDKAAIALKAHLHDDWFFIFLSDI